MAKPTMDSLAFLRKVVEEAEPDVLREMVRSFAETLMSAEASAMAGAAYGERAAERLTRRNGYRARRWDTRTGSIDLRIPKLRQGSYFPDWLLEPRRRAERALVAVVAQACVEGVRTGRVDDLVRAMGIEGMSKSQVSELAASLDEGVRAFRERPLDAGPYRHLWLDALAVRVREAGRIVSVAAVIATAVISSPVPIPGSQRAFCSSLVRSWKYGMQTSDCSAMPSIEPVTPDFAASSCRTAL